MPDPFSAYPVASVMTTLLFLIVVIMMLYGIRHFLFTMNRLTGKQRHPYIDISVARWPMITVFIAAHNEERVVADCIEALLNTDYPTDCLKIIPVNDRSSDATGSIIDSYVARFPSRISPFHRTDSKEPALRKYSANASAQPSNMMSGITKTNSNSKPSTRCPKVR